MKNKAYILGGGVTGLAAALSSGLPLFEARSEPGGICSSYYVRPGDDERLSSAPANGEAYRFEIGGGHWLFGSDPIILRFIKQLTPVKSYNRRSAVYFSAEDRYVPYPLQNNLHCLDDDMAVRALQELAQPVDNFTTMKEWLAANFGPTLCEKFFYPFHDLYTAGLYEEIAPQDAYKSPIKLSQVIQGAFGNARPAGYNVSFVYPEDGLNSLAQRMSADCNIEYGKEVVAIDVATKSLAFSDGTSTTYDELISTLPLNRVMEMTGLETESRPDPHTSVLVLNIGALRGPRCPDDHWLYNPDTQSGFHRVGFYSNVDSSFLPQSMRRDNSGVSIYIERAFVGGDGLAPGELEPYKESVVRELQEWGFIGDAAVVDDTWIDVAYTWSWPGSRWKKQAMKELENHQIYQIGRYARWNFQGIADSIRDGFYAGNSFRQSGTLARG